MGRYAQMLPVWAAKDDMASAVVLHVPRRFRAACRAKALITASGVRGAMWAKECASFLDIGESTFWRWVASGLVPNLDIA